MMTLRATAALALGSLLSACTLAGGASPGPRPSPASARGEAVAGGSAALEAAGLSGPVATDPEARAPDRAGREGTAGVAGFPLIALEELDPATTAPPPGAFLYPDGGLPESTLRQVQEFVHALTEGRASERYRGWLEREAVWGDWIRDELRAAGLPESLVYLAMIESGFEPTIVSHAGATGMWQFMPATARAAGLRVDGWIDERRDPVAATRAAIRHLAELHAATGDWALTAAAYNAGLGRVTRAQAREPEDRRDYFSLSAARRLPRETRNYVPIMIAAAWVDAYRSRYGLPPRVPGTPPTPDTIRADGRVRLSVLARGLGVPYDTLTALNTRLVRGAVPPEGDVVRVPTGTDTTGIAGFLAAVPPAERLLPDWHETRYTVRPGDSYWRIARRHDTTVDRLRRLNPRRGDVIHPGDRLVVRRVASYDIPGEVAEVGPSEDSGSPGGTTTSATVTAPAAADGTTTRAPTGTAPSSEPEHRPGSTVDYTVRAGDTMSGLARRLGVSLDDLARWNHMPGPRPLRTGETLRVAPPVLRYTVRPGDTMTGLAQRYGVTLEQLAEWNAMDRPRPLRVGEMLVVDVR